MKALWEPSSREADREGQTDHMSRAQRERGAPELGPHYSLCIRWGALLDVFLSWAHLKIVVALRKRIMKQSCASV